MYFKTYLYESSEGQRLDTGYVFVRKLDEVWEKY